MESLRKKIPLEIKKNRQQPCKKGNEVFVPCKPEWQIILDNMIYQDQTVIYRICRKMITYLDRINAPEIAEIMLDFTPGSSGNDEHQEIGPNWPKPKGLPFKAYDIIDKVFAIADRYITDKDLTILLRLWLHQENIGFFSRILEQRDAPLGKVKEAVKKYIRLFRPDQVQSDDEIIGLRISLIFRFLSENLSYVNIAKKHLKILNMAEVLDRVYGLANGNGKLGGKSAGLILARQILEDNKEKIPVLQSVKTPKSRFLTSDFIAEFLHYNALEEFVFIKYKNPEEIKQEYTFLEYIFKNSHFPPEALYAFHAILDDLAGRPLIVRSSSLLEDSFEASFSGKYKSLFLSNTGTKAQRLAELMNAIAEVYASTFAPDPIEYRSERGLLDFREEMGILIQEVVGTKIGKYYLPSFAGVAFSVNEFRWSTRIKREDGIVRIVAGLGTRAVDRTMDDYPTLVSPGQPGLKVNQAVHDMIRYSQQYVDVINLETNRFETIDFSKLIHECRGNYPGLEKIVSFERMDDLIDPVSSIVDFTKENLVITFNSLIEKTDFIKQIDAILKLLHEEFSAPVDIEFASDGKNLYLLQCRPQSQFASESTIHIPNNIPDEAIIFTASQFVNNGIVEDIEYIVYVDPDSYAAASNKVDLYETGQIVSKLNRVLPKRKFILIGPGRWGSKGDIKLGVPVIYSDINNTAMLIEVAKEKADYVPELSFGTHFFQDLVEANIKYLPLYPDDKRNKFNEEFFKAAPNSLSDILPEYKDFDKMVRVIKVDNIREKSQLSVCMDGEANRAIAFIGKDFSFKKGY